MSDSKRKRIEIFDTTLRDGTQSEHVAYSLADKLEIAHALDSLGVDYIERSEERRVGKEGRSEVETAEDGIRDTSVTGVQTCALPIYIIESRAPLHERYFCI